MLDDNKKRSIGRPKLANKKLKKNSIIICAICLIGIIVLLIVGAYQLNIIKLKGDSSYKLDVGEPFCLGTECFYTLDDDGEYITALSKYNLLIGYIYNVNENNNVIMEEITNETEGYGLQSRIAKGIDNDSIPWIGLVNYTDSVYWEENGELLSDYGASYPAYVANGSDGINSMLDVYKDKLEEYGYNNFSLRLPSYEDMMDLGCYHIEEEGGGSCDEAPDWVTTSSYWLGSATGDKAWWVSSYMNFFGYEGYGNIIDATLGGIRPVIKIKKNEIAKKYIDYRYGKEICIKEECFNIIDSNDETVTMLAKYNLLVGNNAEIEDDDVKNPTPINGSEAGYGLQNKEALGYVSGSSVAKGVVAFADPIKEDSESEDESYTYYWLDKENDDYVVKDNYKKKAEYKGEEVEYIGLYDSNSNLYSYLDAYRKKLVDLSGYNSITTRAIDFQDYVNILCHDSDCNNGISLPEWYNPTTAWTGMSFDSSEVILLTSDGGATSFEPNTFYAGIRPVITVAITDLEKNDKKEEKSIKYEDIKTANKTTLDSNSDIYKAIKNKEVIPEKATTTTKVKNLGNRLVATNEVCSRWIYIMLLVDGILLLIIIIELILYGKTRKETK